MRAISTKPKDKLQELGDELLNVGLNLEDSTSQYFMALGRAR